MPAKIMWRHPKTALALGHAAPLVAHAGLALAIYFALLPMSGAQLPLTPRATPAATPRPLLLPSGTPRPLLPPAGTTPSSSLLPASRVPLGATPAPANGAPPREIPLVEKKFEELPDQKMSHEGKLALEIDPAKWRHAETTNFIVHYRRATEAQKVVREVEYDLWFVATTLGATREQYAKKSHVFVFEDEAEWKKFLDLSNNPMKWSASYAHGDELFLNVRGGGNSGFGTSFDSHTLAHEATHAIVARLYRGKKRWPLWLNEGFAEYMGGASVAARKGQHGSRYERDLRIATLSPEALARIEVYPENETQRYALYESGEKFVRFLMTEGPKERIAKFVDTIIAGTEVKAAVLEVYGDKFKDWPAFEKRYERFTK